MPKWDFCAKRVLWALNGLERLKLALNLLSRTITIHEKFVKGGKKWLKNEKSEKFEKLIMKSTRKDTASLIPVIK